MQVKKQQLEMDVEQQTGSKSGKEYVKAIYGHPAYLTYMHPPRLPSSPALTGPPHGRQTAIGRTAHPTRSPAPVTADTEISSHTRGSSWSLECQLHVGRVPLPVLPGHT